MAGLDAVFVAAALMWGSIAAWTFRHADDAPRFSGGLGSGMSSRWRRVSAAFLVGLSGLALAVALL